MKILIITTSIFPFEDSQTIRLKQLLSSFSTRNVDLRIIAPSNGCYDNARANLKGWPAGTTIYRTEVHRYLRWKKRIERFNSRLNWIYDNMCYYFFYPDLFSDWQILALKTSKNILLDWMPDIVLSSSGSNTAHLVAMRLQIDFNIPWVADFGDPWSLMDAKFRPWFYLVSKSAEKKVLTSASMVIFTTPETLNMYKKLYQFNGMFLYYGFDKSDFKKSHIEKNTDTLEISHVGAAFKGDRNLIPTILAVADCARVNRVRLNIIGNHSLKFEAVAKRIGFEVNFRQRVPFDEANEYIRSADLLVLIGNKGGLQIPGKVFHYIGSLKPILYVGQRSPLTDPTATLLAQFGGVVFAQNTKLSIDYALKEFIASREKYVAEALSRNSAQAYFEVESGNISDAFYCLIQGLRNK